MKMESLKLSAKSELYEVTSMIVGLIHASSQANKNYLLYDALKKYSAGNDIVNFGCFPDETERYSYIEISLEIGILLASGAIDFIVTGCSSGQGMMLACNSMPGVICGYVPTPNDAYLFAQINNGNAVSLPLGEKYTYSGNYNCMQTLEMLFSEPFGQGYPKEEAARKLRDTELLKTIRKKSQIDLISLLEKLDNHLIAKILKKTDVVDYILTNSIDISLINWIKQHK